MLLAEDYPIILKDKSNNIELEKGYWEELNLTYLSNPPKVCGPGLIYKSLEYPPIVLV